MTPVADVGGAYDGPNGVRRFFTDIADASPDFKIAIESLEAVGARSRLGLHVRDRYRASQWHSHREPTGTSMTLPTARSAHPNFLRP